MRDCHDRRRSLPRQRFCQPRRLVVHHPRGWRSRTHLVLSDLPATTSSKSLTLPYNCRSVRMGKSNCRVRSIAPNSIQLCIFGPSSSS